MTWFLIGWVVCGILGATYFTRVALEEDGEITVATGLLILAAFLIGPVSLVVIGVVNWALWSDRHVPWVIYRRKVK